MFGRVKGIRLDTSLRTTVKKEAEEIAKERFKKALGRAHGVTIIKNIKLTLLMEKYLEYCRNNNRPSTFKKKRFNVNNLLDFFGDSPVSAITPSTSNIMTLFFAGELIFLFFLSIFAKE